MPDPVAVWWSLFSGVALLGVKECILIAELSASDRCWGPMASLWPSGSCSGSPVVVREGFLSFLCYFNLRLPLLLRTCIFQNLFFFVLCSFIHITFSHDCPSPHPIEFKAIWPYMAPPHPPPPKNAVSLSFPISCRPAPLLPLPPPPKWQTSITVCHLAELQVASVIVLLTVLIYFPVSNDRFLSPGLNGMEMRQQIKVRQQGKQMYIKANLN